MPGSIRRRFFLPGCEDDETKAETTYANIRGTVSRQEGRELSHRRICHLKWNHNGKDCEATVGGAAPPDPTSRRARYVLGIFESSDGQLYYVVVGCGRNSALGTMVGLDEIRAVEWFEGYGLPEAPRS